MAAQPDPKIGGSGWQPDPTPFWSVLGLAQRGAWVPFLGCTTQARRRAWPASSAPKSKRQVALWGEHCQGWTKASLGPSSAGPKIALGPARVHKALPRPQEDCPNAVWHFGVGTAKHGPRLALGLVGQDPK
jgi:hypothetical protein